MTVRRLAVSLLLTFALQPLLAGLRPLPAQTAAAPPAADEARTIAAIEKAAPAVVSIATTETMSAAGSRRGVGSGFIISRDGYILTNAHVVEDTGSIRVVLATGQIAPARVLGVDRQTDVALLKIEPPGGMELPVAELGDSDTIRVGQTAIALGNPLGLGLTASRGIVTAKNRALPIDRYHFLDNAIQTDASINPGNSGGPIVDSAGVVIGMSTAIIREAENIAFAIPINTAKAVLGDLRDRGKVVRAWVGVSGQIVPPGLIALLRVPLARGLLIEGVERDSPAARAGLRAGRITVQIEGQRFVVGGDVITEINGQPVETPDQYVRALLPLRPGDSVTLTILRDGVRQPVAFTLGERP